MTSENEPNTTGNAEEHGTPAELTTNSEKVALIRANTTKSTNGTPDSKATATGDHTNDDRSVSIQSKTEDTESESEAQQPASGSSEETRAEHKLANKEETNDTNTKETMNNQHDDQSNSNNNKNNDNEEEEDGNEEEEDDDEMESEANSSSVFTDDVAAATAEAIARAATRGIEQAQKDQAADPASASLINQLAEMKPEDHHINASPAATAAAAAAAGAQSGEAAPHVSLALLLEATAAAAEVEKNAGFQQVDLAALKKRAQECAATDKYITDAIHRVQTTPRTDRGLEMRPEDRREKQIPSNWSRYEEIMNNPQLLGECRRLVRGTQGCGRDCDAKFTNLVDFAKHVDEQHDHGFRPFLCPKAECPWAIIGFHERSECTRHIRTKHYKAMYYCEFHGCTKVYNRSDAFRRHVRQAHGNPGSRFNRMTHRSDDDKQAN